MSQVYRGTSVEEADSRTPAPQKLFQLSCGGGTELCETLCFLLIKGSRCISFLIINLFHSCPVQTHRCLLGTSQFDLLKQEALKQKPETRICPCSLLIDAAGSAPTALSIKHVRGRVFQSQTTPASQCPSHGRQLLRHFLMTKHSTTTFRISPSLMLSLIPSSTLSLSSVRQMLPVFYITSYRSLSEDDVRPPVDQTGRTENTYMNLFTQLLDIYFLQLFLKLWLNSILEQEFW